MYFHVQWRRQNPLPYQTEYTVLDGVSGKGRFAGMYLAWGQNNGEWWGEGEVKFYIDGDKDVPTYCGTGTEDYFGGAWCFNNLERNSYENYSTCLLYTSHVPMFLTANTSGIRAAEPVKYYNSAAGDVYKRQNHR